MKTFGSRGHWFLLPLLATVGWDSCHYFSKTPTPPNVKTVNVSDQCKPDQDPVRVHTGEQIAWQPSTFSAHFNKEDKTPFALTGNPPVIYRDVPPGKPTPTIAGDNDCNQSSQKNCYYKYSLFNEDTKKQCNDPGVHVTP
jgi:hypothetical protein